MSMLNAETSFLLLQEGRKTEALEVSTHCGGGGVNAAVAMARLGVTVATLIKIGRDERAEMILARLQKEGISSRWVIRDGTAPTGASVLVSSHDRDAALFTFRGANTLLAPDDLRDQSFAVDLVYVSNLSNKSADCLSLIIDKAKSNGAPVAVNPGVRQLGAAAPFSTTCQRSTFSRSTGRRPTCWCRRWLRGSARVAPHCHSSRASIRPRCWRADWLGGGFEMSLPAFWRCASSARKHR
jgi:ribokinase